MVVLGWVHSGAGRLRNCFNPTLSLHKMWFICKLQTYFILKRFLESLVAKLCFWLSTWNRTQENQQRPESSCNPHKCKSKFFSLHSLHFPLTFGPVLCSSGETVTSVTSMSPLQPKKVKKKKEKEKLEQPPAIPAKGMKTEAEVFQILSTTMEGQQSAGCQESCTIHCLCLWVACSCSHLEGKNALPLLLGQAVPSLQI